MPLERQRFFAYHSLLLPTSTLLTPYLFRTCLCNIENGVEGDRVLGAEGSDQPDEGCVGHCVGEGPSAGAFGATRGPNFDFKATSITCTTAGKCFIAH